MPADELINKVTWMIPNALALIGSRSGDEWNGMTASWVSQLAMEPVLVGVSVEQKAVTHRLISESGVLSINLWDPDDTRVFVKFSKPATKEDMALNDRPIREGATGAPIFTDAVAWIELEVRHTLDLGTHTLFVGELIDCGLGEKAVERAAAITDTRMKYGGVKRGGQ
ncbi:MAG: flavin reductase family protein [Acidimicrobiia bacterium]